MFNIVVLESLLSRLSSPICAEQLETWHSIFQAYAGFTGVIAAVITFILGKSYLSTSDYQRKGYIYTTQLRLLWLLMSSITVYLVIEILLTWHACTDLGIWAVLLTTLLTVVPIALLIYAIIGFFGFSSKTDGFIKGARTRFRSMARKATKSRLYREMYKQEISHVTTVIENSIVQGKSKEVQEASRWLQNVILGTLVKNLSSEELETLTSIVNTARDEYAKLLIEAEATGNRGLLEHLLVDVELSAQHFVMPGTSKLYHVLLDTYQLAFGRSTGCYILQKYISFFAQFGNLRAAIRVIDHDVRLPFKLATLSTTLILICQSLRVRGCESACAALINMLKSLDTMLLPEGESSEDFTGLGTWLLVFSLMHLIKDRSPGEEVRRGAEHQYETMCLEWESCRLKAPPLEEAKECLLRSKDKVLKSSTGSTFSFCITEAYPGYHDHIEIYLNSAINILTE